ncbi:hypothetical protein [Microvirga arabica]|uniref:hypothetical protein n=1 Tax=Microvirga arabica TaxID=1128671 RepID=UPI001939299F|nr:hypothetical protein [Microvirga arabica]MBM1169875.1 hypothetical protein [Microvirga arabica]
MTLLELEAAIYAATLDSKVREIISAYVQQERDKNAEKQRRNRATRAAAKAITSQSPARHGDSPRARGDYNNFSNQDLEKETLPAEWEPKDFHIALLIEDGREASYIQKIARLFRWWVEEQGIMSSNWDAFFGSYVERHLTMSVFRHAGRVKVGPEANKAAAVSEPIKGLPDDVLECLEILATGETRLPRRFSKRARTDAHKLHHVRSVALTAKTQTSPR